MRIAYFSPRWPSERARNGVVTYVDHMRRAMVAAGHEAVVIAGELDDDANADDAFSIKRGEKGFMRRLKHRARRAALSEIDAFRHEVAEGVTRALDAAAQKQTVDIFEIEEFYGVAPIVEKATGVRTVIRLHGPFVLTNRQPLDAAAKARIAAEADALGAAHALSAPSPMVVRGLEDYLKLSLAHAAIIPNPIIPPTGPLWRREDADPNLILFVGHFNGVKGADILLQAFALHAKRHSESRLVMAGPDHGVYDEEGALLKFDDFAAHRLSPGIREKIEFVGPVDQTELQGLRRQAFLTVAPSRWDTFPYASAEALSLGCPFVTTSANGLAALFEHEEIMRITPPGDAIAFAEELDAVMSDRSASADMGARAADVTRDILQPEVVASQAERFYHKVLHAAPDLAQAER